MALPIQARGVAINAVVEVAVFFSCTSCGAMSMKRIWYCPVCGSAGRVNVIRFMSTMPDTLFTVVEPRVADE